FALSASEAGAVVCARRLPRRLRRAARRGGDASRLLPPPLSLSRRSGHLPVGQKSYRNLGIGYPAPRRGRDEAHVPAPDPEWGLGADTMRDRAAKPSPFWST